VDVHWFRDNWALAIALAVLLSLVVIGLLHVLRSSGRGQLRRALKDLSRQRKALGRASAAVAEANRKYERLQGRAEKVKPRHLDEARGALHDARALAKIAHDQVLVAENHVRRIIVEEFPRAKQARLRARYHVGDTPDKKPFTF
jgi:hypothetical protein